jgi:hypothetical protein
MPSGISPCQPPIEKELIQLSLENRVDPRVSALEQGGDNLKGFKDFQLNPRSDSGLGLLFSAEVPREWPL